MTFQTTNCVALGVPDVVEGATFYERVLGFVKLGQGDDWIELQSGALRLFITKNDGTTPTFDLSVSDVAEASKHLIENGFERLGESNGEVYLRDPYGNAFAVSKRSV